MIRATTDTKPESTPLALHEEPVRAAWIDYNGHMNVAYYVLVFDHATDAFLERVGLDDAHREATGGSVFVVETHVTYVNEVHEGQRLAITTQVLGADDKRLRLFHRMVEAESGTLAATNEVMILHVDLNVRRVTPWPDAARWALMAQADAHAALDIPPEAGRGIAMPANRP